MRVLIADDDQDLCDLITIAVEKAGYSVVAAVSNGADAWHVLHESDEVDLAVLDISMPELTGLELTEKIRADPELRELSILIITANVQPSTAEAVHLAGANGLITKPFVVMDLIAFVRDVADRL